MKILLVEDSKRLQRSISIGLTDLGHIVDQAFDGAQALEFTSIYDYDVIVLDLMLPKIDGLSVLSKIRESRIATRVLILSAMDQTSDRIRGLDIGADDYLVKPFSFNELLSRINALFRRRASIDSPVIEIGDLYIDSAKREIRFAGKLINVTPFEFSLVEYLGKRRGTVHSQQQLIDRLYNASTCVTKNALEAHISELRKRLKGNGVPPLITTRRGFGYLIE